MTRWTKPPEREASAAATRRSFPQPGQKLTGPADGSASYPQSGQVTTARGEDLFRAIVRGESNKGWGAGKARRGSHIAHRRARVLAALVLCAVASRGGAQEGRPRGRLEARLGVQYFDYAETYQGTTLDTEQGFLPALSVEGELRGDIAYGRLALRLGRGTVDYRGLAQASPPDPTVDGLTAVSTSDAQLLSAQLEAGAAVDPGRRLQLFLGLGARRWNRDIHDTVVVSRTGVPTPLHGPSEVYSWFLLDVGARYAILETPRDGWDVEASLLRTLAPRIEVGFQGSTVSLDLGAQFGWRVGSTYRRALRKDLSFTAGAWAEGYAFGASAVDPTFGILEPDSRTVTVGVDVGVAFGL